MKEVLVSYRTPLCVKSQVRKLAKAGCEPLVTDSVDEAIRLIRERDFHAVISGLIFEGKSWETVNGGVAIAKAAKEKGIENVCIATSTPEYLNLDMPEGVEIFKGYRDAFEKVIATIN